MTVYVLFNFLQCGTNLQHNILLYFKSKRKLCMVLASIYFISYVIVFYEHAIMKHLVLNRLMIRLFEQIYIQVM